MKGKSLIYEEEGLKTVPCGTRIQLVLYSVFHLQKQLACIFGLKMSLAMNELVL